jgi:hypothetical protein
MFEARIHDQISETDARDLFFFTIWAYDDRGDCCESDIMETRGIVGSIRRRIRQVRHGGQLHWQK